MQSFCPATIFKYCFRDARWRLTLKDDSVVVNDDNLTITIDCATIEKITTAGIIFPTTVIGTNQDQHIVLPWLHFISAPHMVAAIRQKTTNVLLQKFNLQLSEINVNTESFYKRDIYISNRDFLLWLNSIPNFAARMNALQTIWNHSFFDQYLLSTTVLQEWQHHHSLLSDNRTELFARNEAYVEQEEIRFNRFFNTVETLPLTVEQRKAAIIMEDRNLLVAAAGSGKTSAIVGKIGYLLKKQYCPPSQILIMAFNRNAATELRQRIDRRLGNETKEITINTFHQFGLSVIAKARQNKPAIAQWTINMDESAESNKIWEDIVNKIMEQDNQFFNHFNQLVTYFRWAIKPLHLFGNKNAYEQYLMAIRAKKRGGEDGDNWGVQSIKGEWMNSLEEVTIANWLYVNNIEYEYEKPYPNLSANEDFRQYMPDFYYPQVDVYHEHFALDQYGNAPLFFKDGYAKEAQKKREIHMRYNTDLIETTSAMFEQGDVLETLKNQLSAKGIVFGDRRPFSEINSSIREQFIKPIYGIIQKFLIHWKSNGMEETDLVAQTNNLKGFQKVRTILFIKIMIRIRREYEKILREKNEIDFEDMLVGAEQCLRHNDWRHPYKIILVDEFQDISRSRANMIKSMLAQNLNCKMFAVGDDWQSIYRFAGSDVSVMANFSDEFGVTSENYLGKVFRSNQGIANVASEFISKNPSQLSKQITATDDNLSGVVQVINYINKGEDSIFIGRQLETINARNARAKVYILARYNHLQPESMAAWKKQFGKTLDIQFSTIHRAKGQEADYVFVIGMNSGEYGFPSETEDDPLLQIVMPKPEQYEHAEERRLFYVALTRARYKVFLLAKKQNRSAFINEILVNKCESVHENDMKESGEISEPQVLPECPECGGVLKQITGQYGAFWGCTNYPKCKHKKNIPKKQNRSAFINEILANKCESIHENDMKESGEISEPQVLPECPECGGVLKQRTGQYGAFLGCSNYPKCKHTKNIPKQ